MLYIGDIHHDAERYTEIIRRHPESIQVGDFGVGFFSRDEEEALLARPATTRHRFIRGNHDDPGRVSDFPGYVPDGHYDHATSTLFVGGSWSINRHALVPGLSWWHDEEVSPPVLAETVETMRRERPRVLVTHDAPLSISQQLFTEFEPIYATRTAVGLQCLLDVHEPELWVFGHWHTSRDAVIGKTRFVCLNKLEARELP